MVSGLKRSALLPALAKPTSVSVLDVSKMKDSFISTALSHLTVPSKYSDMPWGGLT